jgi:hypothetical protein
LEWPRAVRFVPLASGKENHLMGKLRPNTSRSIQELDERKLRLCELIAHPPERRAKKHTVGDSAGKAANLQPVMSSKLVTREQTDFIVGIACPVLVCALESSAKSSS